MTFWAYILFARRPTSGGGLPFCHRHRNYWSQRARFVVVGLIAIVALMVLGAVLTPSSPPGLDVQPHWVFGVGACWMLRFLPLFLIVHLSAMRPTGGNRKLLKLSGVNREFAAAVNSQRSRAESDTEANHGSCPD